MGKFIDENIEIKDDYLVDRSRFQFRRANKTDDVDSMAELIYKTDPYIYPFWFNNDIKEAKRYLTNVLLSDGKLFSVQNFYVAYDKIEKRIVAILCAVDNTVRFSHAYGTDKLTNSRFKFTIENYVEGIEKEAEELDDNEIYISNICVTDTLRGMKIGSYLIGYFIDNMEKNGVHTFKLDCLLHNLRAKNLYHSFGFKEMKEIVGFDGTETSTVEVVSFLRKKGNYYPQEFQISFMDVADKRI